MLSPWVRVHPVHWHILQTCSDSWGKAMGVHSTGRHPEKTEGSSGSRSCHRRHSSPGIFSQDISVLTAHFALHYENCGGARKQLFGDGLRVFGRALRSCSYNKYPCASHSFCWNWETPACLSLGSDSSWGYAYRAHGCSHKTPHLDTFILE